ncbi:MAG: NAD-dependent epimerase/dehydratase family protein [Caulobacteraceae bacterium]
MIRNKIIEDDLRNIYLDIGVILNGIEGSSFLISGGGGFIGSYFIDLINYCNENIFLEPVQIICIDNFITGVPDRINHLMDCEDFIFMNTDITYPISINQDVDFIIHAASIASPTFYRKYPIETIETNVLGLKNLLDLGNKKRIKSFLNLSSSEIYGDPDEANIPTKEEYKGYVSCTGPRACYDESKRLGETLCVNYFREFGSPVKIVRPFNVYGPGLKLSDKRVIPDFFSDAMKKKKIRVLSDGSPTRSFCYISDAIEGFMLALLSDYSGEAFNIGNASTEISMENLAAMIAKIVGDVEIEYKQSEEKEYLTDNPKRRCPDLAKSGSLLGYSPKVGLEKGLGRLYEWYRRVES